MKKHCPGLFAALVVLLAAGCDTINHTQFQVAGQTAASGTRLAISTDDRDAVRQVVQAAAQELHYEDRLPQTLMPNTIASYAEPDNDNPITIVAWVKDQTIVVDIMHKPTDLGESSAYRKVHDLLTTALKNRFGTRVEIAPVDKQISSRTILTP
jgi:hypothetical protein